MLPLVGVFQGHRHTRKKMHFVLSGHRPGAMAGPRKAMAASQRITHIFFARMDTALECSVRVCCIASLGRAGAALSKHTMCHARRLYLCLLVDASQGHSHMRTKMQFAPSGHWPAKPGSTQGYPGLRRSTLAHARGCKLHQPAKSIRQRFVSLSVVCKSCSSCF